MKKLLVILLLIPAFGFAQAQELEKGIHFEQSSFSEILAKAKKENKMIFIDAYTTWCGPCKWMAKEIFTNDTVAEFYNKNFINLKIDMEKVEGIDFRKKYEVGCYPTFLFIDGNGQLLHRTSGGMPAKNFVELGMSAISPEKQFASAKKKYDSGSTSSAEIIQYITMRSSSCLPMAQELAKYFITQKEEDLTKRENWSAIRDFTDNANSREFQYFISHRADFEKLYTTDSVSRKIEQVYSSSLFGYIYTNNLTAGKKEPDTDFAGYQKMKEKIKELNLPSSEKIILNADMSLYKKTKDWNQYAQSAVKYIDNFKREDYNALNSMAWDFYENVNDKVMLAKAAEWAKHSTELKPEYANFDTYAAVLYKLGKKNEAKAAAKKAIELGEKDGEDCTSTRELLEKINVMK